MHRQLLQTDFTANLIKIFGEQYRALTILDKNCLQIIYQHQHFATEKITAAAQLANILFAKQHPVTTADLLPELDSLKRKVRKVLQTLEARGFVEKQGKVVEVKKLG